MIPLSGAPLKPGESLTLAVYRCRNCSVGFGLEPTVAGPKYCPACGEIFGMDYPCTVVDLCKVIDTIALELNPAVSAKWSVWIHHVRKFLFPAQRAEKE